ncbi:hypothetical protein TrST_g2731 [Triparma strigata]|uniref:Sphingomyelin synthase-like domain-containing protein n=1 Tax=Triparma strigata TaxID=1606541 RepID=A0A9W7EFI2_9STRA|nr:hypothetical protein TrST_g2731 [Triparma strigata]
MFHPVLLQIYLALFLLSFLTYTRTYGLPTLSPSKLHLFLTSPSSLKTLLCLLIWTISYFLMSFLGGTIAYWRFPRTPGNAETPSPLPDLIFNLFPETCPKIFGQNLQSLTLIIYYTYLTLIILPFHPSSEKILRHFLLLNSLMFLTRTTTVSITSLPQPNYTPKCLLAQNSSSTFLESLHVVMGRGFPPKSCGDLIYSGHASCAIISMYIIEYHNAYFGRKYVRRIGWSLVGIAVGSIFMCRSHYGVDVVLAGYFSAFLGEGFYLRLEGRTGRWGEEIVRWLGGEEEDSYGKRKSRRRNTGQATGESEILLKDSADAESVASSVNSSREEEGETIIGGCIYGGTTTSV